MIDQLLQLDTAVFVFLNNLGTTGWDGFWLAYTAKFNWIPFYAVLLYFVFKQMPLKTFLITIVVVALMIVVTDQITNLFKYGFQRLRPCYAEDLIGKMRLVKSGCGGRYGYFSGHASNSMAVAIFIGLTLKTRFKYLIYILGIWAILMGYSRIYIGVHYPLDVVSGLLFGGTVGFLFFKLNTYLGNKFAEKPKKEIVK